MNEEIPMSIEEVFFKPITKGGKSMVVQGNMVMLKLNEYRTGNNFRLSGSSLWSDVKVGDHYTAETHVIDNGNMVLAIIKKCTPDNPNARRVNAEKRIVFPLPKELQTKLEKKKNYGGYHQIDLFGGKL